MKKQILTFLLALCLMASLSIVAPITANAATYGDYTYTVSKGKVTITDCSTSISGAITIPSEIGGYPVTTIGWGAFWNCTSLTSVTIPDSVTSIGIYAFDNTAYYNNSNNWENNVLYIGNHLIKANTTISGAYIVKAGTKCIADSAFGNCESLTGITIPNSVTSIGEYAFKGCTSLTSITIPDSVISIGEYAFKYCTSLTSVTIPDSVTYIGSWAFENCTSLTNITIPDSLTSISYGMFKYCTSLTSVTIGNSVSIIESDVFYNCKSLINIVIPDSVTTIGGYTFKGCTSLTSVTIGNSVTSINGYAFQWCYSLTDITIPDSVTSIGDSAFNDCTSLTSITIPNSVTSISSFAFWGCTSLTSVTIGNGVSTIGLSAFEYCTSLTDVYYIGTEEEWNKISIGLNNECLTNATIHYNYVDSSNTKMIQAENVTINNVDKIKATTANIPADSQLILACYLDGQLTYLEPAIKLEAENTYYFTPKADYDFAKVMAWEKFSNLVPVCEAAPVQ